MVFLWNEAKMFISQSLLGRFLCKYIATYKVHYDTI